MSKMIKNIFYDKLTYEKMYEAYKRAIKNKGYRLEVLNFEYNIEKNLISIVEDLKNDKYRLGKYREFKVYEPKERIIKSLPFRDWVVHQWFVKEFLTKYIVPRFIYDSYACIDNKGTLKAVNRLQYFMRKMQRENHDYYVLKMDIHKFFYSIDQCILFNIIKKYIKDKRLLSLCQKFIFDDDKLGIPIGNYTSQYFANIYLNELDYYVKYDLKIKYYLRYMDDFILLVENKDKAKTIYNSIENFANQRLYLLLNPKSRVFPNKMRIDFCGYRIFSTHILLRTKYKRKVLKTVKKWNHLYQEKKLNYAQFFISFNSIKAHLKHANSYNLLKKIDNKIVRITQ